MRSANHDTVGLSGLRKSFGDSVTGGLRHPGIHTAGPFGPEETTAGPFGSEETTAGPFGPEESLVIFCSRARDRTNRSTGWCRCGFLLGLERFPMDRRSESSCPRFGLFPSSARNYRRNASGCREFPIDPASYRWVHTIAPSFRGSECSLAIAPRNHKSSTFRFAFRSGRPLTRDC